MEKRQHGVVGKTYVFDIVKEVEAVLKIGLCNGLLVEKRFGELQPSRAIQSNATSSNFVRVSL